MFLPFNSKSSNPTNWNQVNILAKDVGKSKVTQIFNDQTDRRVLLGKGKSDFYGLKVSKPGFDVYDAGDDDLIFNSDNNVFKIVLSGVTTISVAAFDTYEEVNVAHGLGYAPLVVAYVDVVGDGANYDALPYTSIETSGAGSGNIARHIKVNTNSLYLRFYCFTPDYAANPLKADDYTFNIKYYVIQETAN